MVVEDDVAGVEAGIVRRVGRLDTTSTTSEVVYDIVAFQRSFRFAFRRNLDLVTSSLSVTFRYCIHFGLSITTYTIAKVGTLQKCFPK